MSLVNHAIWRIGRSSCPPNMLHGNRCGWLQSKQTQKRVRSFPLKIQQHKTFGFQNPPTPSSLLIIPGRESV